jgi:hypothetical protein
MPMPSDWISKKAAEENREQKEARKREETKLRETELIRGLGPLFVENLRTMLNEDIVAWNEHFGDRQINGAGKIPNGFSVAKEGFPRGLAEVTFNPSTLSIDVKLVRSTHVDHNKTYETDGGFYLEANPDGRDIHMLDRMRRAHVQPAGFSRILLESIADPNSQHLI